MSIDSIDTKAGDPKATAAARAPGNLDLLVTPAMLLVAVAAGVAGYLHLGLAPEVAAAISLALFCIMLLSHVVLRPARTVPAGQTATAETAAKPAKARPAAVRSKPAPKIAPHTPQTVPQSPPAVAASAEAPAAASEQRQSFRPVALELPEVEPAAVALSPTVQDETVPASVVEPTVAEAVVEALADAAAREPAADAIADEAQRVDEILKKLAAQIRAGIGGVEQARRPEAVSVAPECEASDEVPTQSMAVTEPVTEPEAVAEALAASAPPSVPDTPPLAEQRLTSETALESAVDALRATVEAMRTGTARPAMAAQPPATAERTPTPAEIRLAAVAEALSAERADVFLEPILGLAEDTARHFEISIRLRAADGEAFERADITADSHAAGLLPVLDALGVKHSAGFALKLERKGREGSVFSEVAGASFESPRFVADVAGRHAQGVADRLVLALDQHDVGALGAVQLAALKGLRALGFRFALTGLHHLDMDFDALKATGFDFVKLDAAVFAGGLALGAAHVPADELARHFSEHGLGVIAGHIDSEETKRTMLAYGVALGQGSLFGSPRAVPIASAETSVAAA